MVAIVHPFDQRTGRHALRLHQAPRLFVINVMLAAQSPELIDDPLALLGIVGRKRKAQGDDLVGHLRIERYAHRSHQWRHVTIFGTRAVGIRRMVIVIDHLQHQVGNILPSELLQIGGQIWIDQPHQRRIAGGNLIEPAFGRLGFVVIERAVGRAIGMRLHCRINDSAVAVDTTGRQARLAGDLKVEMHAAQKNANPLQRGLVTLDGVFVAQRRQVRTGPRRIVSIGIDLRLRHPAGPATAHGCKPDRTRWCDSATVPR